MIMFAMHALDVKINFSAFFQVGYSALDPELLQILIQTVGLKLFHRVTVKKLLWGGNGATGLFSPVSENGPKNKTNTFLKSPAPSLTLMCFPPQYNGTTDGRYNVFTGEDDINKVGLIDRWNGNE